MSPHLVQTKNWSDFKNIYGTSSYEVSDVFYTIHKIPLINKYYAYCPKVNPFKIDFEKLSKKLKKQNVIAINFDRPDVELHTDEASKAVKLLENEGCVVAFKDTFPPATVLLDISKSENELLKNFSPKHRYNLNVALRKNLKISFVVDDQKIEEFYFLQKLTSDRQKYLIRPKKYYETMINFYNQKEQCVLANVYYEKEPIASWIFLIEGQTAYYVHGGMNENFNHLKPSNFLVWESIIELKRRGVKMIDLMGACEDLNNTKDPYHGFTVFKIRFGGKHIKYIKSFDLVINNFWYQMFNLAQRVRWMGLKFFKRI